MMKNDSLSMAKTAISKDSDSASPSRSVQPVREGPESDLNLLRRTVQRAACDGCAPSAEGIAAELARMPPHQRASAVMGLQQTLGNARVGRLAVQAKLKLGPVGDRYEQEADRVARRVVEAISSSDQDAVQRQEVEEEEEEELRRKVDGTSPAGGIDVGPDLESSIQRARSGGQPLSGGLRQPMERAFCADFGGVRVHADDQADSLNRSLQARAFTTGQDIFLRRGEYRPTSSEGQRLLAHELTHVVQQEKMKISVQRNGGPGQTPPPPPPPLPSKKTKIPVDPELKLLEIYSSLELYKNPSEGTFEYVAQYIYSSIQREEDKKVIFKDLFEFKDDKWKPKQTNTLDDAFKKQILNKMVGYAFGEFKDKKSAEDIRDVKITQKGSLKVGIGFHGTSGMPSLVYRNPIDKGGWGGIKTPITVDFFRKRYALDAKWNPLQECLGKGPHYRMGENWDNELLSTVSIATKPEAAIKFPFPSSASDEVVTYLYAAVVESAYLTYEIQEKEGKTAFPEIAVQEVNRDDIIGTQQIKKKYNTESIKEINKIEGLGLDLGNLKKMNNEVFAYYCSKFYYSGFNDILKDIYDEVRPMIEEKIGEDGWGIYNNMKITKK